MKINNIMVSVLLGVLCSGVVSFVLLLLVAGVSGGGKIEICTAQALVHIVRFVAVLFGVLVCASVLKEKYLVTSMSVTFGYIFLLCLLGVMLYDNPFTGFGFGVLYSVLGGGVGCLISLKLQQRPDRKKKYKR